MNIKQRYFNKYGAEVNANSEDMEETRISFYFDDGDNWHFQLHEHSSKEELLTALLGVGELITVTLNNQER